MLIKRRNEPNWRSPEVTAYDDEAAIQALLAQSLDLLPGGAGQPRAVALKVALDVGSVDLIAVAADGTITLVECKLRANPEIRRHVVGQALAYAAPLWEMSYEAFDQAFAARAGIPLARAVAAIAETGWDEETFRTAVAEHLASGRVRLVIAVDRITDELRRIVRFLNSHATPELEVLALELGYVADSGVEVLVPTVYGAESAGAKAAAAGGRWSAARFFAALASSVPSVSAKLNVRGAPIAALSLSEWPKGSARLDVNFEYLVGKVDDGVLERLAAGLRAIPDAERLAGLEAAGYKKRPGVPLAARADPAAFGRLQAAIDAPLTIEPGEPSSMSGVPPALPADDV